jgi:hypothetical protein
MIIQASDLLEIKSGLPPLLYTDKENRESKKKSSRNAHSFGY